MVDRILTITDENSNEMEVFINSSGKISLSTNMRFDNQGEVITLDAEDANQLIKELKSLVKHI